MKTVTEVEAELAKCQFGTDHQTDDFPYLHIGIPAEPASGICERGYLHA